MEKRDLIVRVDELTGEVEILREELNAMQQSRNKLRTKVQELEDELKKTKEQVKQQSDNDQDENDVPLAQRKRFTRVEMAMVLMERNQYKERLMELQEAVRLTEILRTTRTVDNLDKKSKQSIAPSIAHPVPPVNASKRIQPTNSFSSPPNLSSTYAEVEFIARTWTHKLKRLPKEQRLVAEKCINDILFEAELGSLHRGSMQLNALESYVRFEDSQNDDSSQEKPQSSTAVRTSTNNGNSTQSIKQNSNEAEKCINDIFFEAESGSLHRGSLQLNVLESYVRFEDSQNDDSSQEKPQSPTAIRTSTNSANITQSIKQNANEAPYNSPIEVKTMIINDGSTPRALHETDNRNASAFNTYN